MCAKLELFLQKNELILIFYNIYIFHIYYLAKFTRLTFIL